MSTIHGDVRTPVTITANSNHTAVTRLGGYSIRESAATAAAAAVNLRRGTVAGQIIAVIELAANGSVTDMWPGLVGATGGVYVEVVAGTVEGVLFEVA